MTCVGGARGAFVATSCLAPEVCLCRPGAWRRVRKCSPGGGFAGKLLRLEHFLFPSNNRKCPRSWGYSWLVSAAPFLLYLLPSPASPFPLPLPSPPPGTPGGVCVCGSARAPHSHPLGRTAAVRVRVPVRRRAPVRGPQRTHPRREREGATV